MKETYHPVVDEEEYNEHSNILPRDPAGGSIVNVTGAPAVEAANGEADGGRDSTRSHDSSRSTSSARGTGGSSKDKDKDPPAEQQLTSRKKEISFTMLILVLAALVFTNSINYVLYVRLAGNMKQYTWYVCMCVCTYVHDVCA